MEKKQFVGTYIWSLILSGIAAGALFASSFVVSQIYQLIIGMKWMSDNQGSSQEELIAFIQDYFTNSENLLVVITIRNILIAIVAFIIVEITLKGKTLGNPIKAFPKLTFPGTLAIAMGLELILSCVLITIGSVFPGSMDGYSQVVTSMGFTNLSVVSTIATLVAAPLAEEILFRGLIMKLLQKGGYNFWVANVIQAVFFGIVHGNLVQGLYAFVMGFTFGLIYKRTGKIWACIVAHIVFNAFGTYGVALIFGHVETLVGIILPGIVGVITIVAGAVMMMFGKEKAKEN